MLIDLENIVGCSGYFIDDITHEIWSFKRKTPVKLKLRVDIHGYLNFTIYNEGKHKPIKYHQVIVRLFVDPDYNPKTQQIDHIDHNKLNNSIDNLKVVTRNENQMNLSAYGGKQAVYIDDIGESIPVNAEHGIYYSKTFDKFYRLVEHVEKYRQLHECKNHAHMKIGYAYNKKIYRINCTKFREGLTK